MLHRRMGPVSPVIGHIFSQSTILNRDFSARQIRRPHNLYTETRVAVGQIGLGLETLSALVLEPLGARAESVGIAERQGQPRVEGG